MSSIKKINFSLYGQIIKIDGNKKFFKPYGEQKILPVKIKDDLKVGDSVKLTLYESPNFNFLKVSLVKFAKVPVYLKSYEKTSDGINVKLETKDGSVRIERNITKTDPLLISLKEKKMLIAAIFDDSVFLEPA